MMVSVAIANGRFPHARWSWYQFYLMLLSLLTYSNALQITYCSPQLVGESKSNTSIYMSNGLCNDNCLGFAFAVISGVNCWCSDTAPSTLVDTALCDYKCPGYPDDTCGNPNQSLYAYFNLGRQPSGTAAALTTSTSSTASSSDTATSESTSTSSTSVNDAPLTFTSTDTSAIAAYIQTAIPAADRTESTNPCFVNQQYTYYSTPTWYAQWPTQVQSYYSVSNQGATAACTLTPSEISSTSAAQSSSGLSRGAKAGIAIGVIIGVLLIAAILIFCIVRRKRNRRDHTHGLETSKADIEHNDAARPEVSYTRYSQEHLPADQPAYPQGRSPANQHAYSQEPSSVNRHEYAQEQPSVDQHDQTSQYSEEELTALPAPPIPQTQPMTHTHPIAHTQVTNSTSLGTSSVADPHRDDSSIQNTLPESDNNSHLAGPSRPWLNNPSGRTSSEMSMDQQFFPALQQQNPYQLPELDFEGGGTRHTIPRKPVGTGAAGRSASGSGQGGRTGQLGTGSGLGPSRMQHLYNNEVNSSQGSGADRSWYHAM